MKQELTKELAAYTATKFLLDVCGENINATATIVDAEAKVREGNDEGYATLCDALVGAREFIQDLLEVMEGGRLWYDAQGDVLPDIDREVIVLCMNGKVCFGHRPDPKGFNCKNVDTGEMEHLEPMTYDKGGWNISDVKWWLDLDLPIINI